jgi:integrase
VIFVAGTGVRQGEAMGLTLDRVDLDRREVRIERQLIRMVRGQPVFGPPKTPASYRTVPLPDVVVEALRTHVTELDVQMGDLVFTLDGGPISRQAFGHKWRPVAKEAGLPIGTGIHSLRHYYASLLIRHGQSVKTVQARLGHASAAETLDTYSHLWPDSDDRTREAVDQVLGDSCGLSADC